MKTTLESLQASWAKLDSIRFGLDHHAPTIARYTESLALVPAPDSMREVTKEAFYVEMGPRNVNPSIVNKYEERGRGYIQHWKDGRGLLGITFGGCFPFTPPRYFLTA